MTVELRLPSPLEPLSDDRLARRGVRLLLKRDDLIHPELRGNKWRKLRYNLARAAQQRRTTLLTFGGAYSNHVRATAAAGHHFGFATIGVIRGEEHLPLNPTLEYAVSRGMRLVYLDRSTYRRKHSPEVIDRLRREYGEFYLLPEGGSNDLAARGCAELPAEITEPFDVICCPVGTGGTLAGIAAGLEPGQRAIGFSALKGGEFLAADVERLQRATFGSTSGGSTSGGSASGGSTSANWHIEYGFHFGGYAKRPPELDAFVADWADRHGAGLEPIYVAKMMYGIVSLAEAGSFEPGTTVVAVITG